jgi:hypothetical protein
LQPKLTYDNFREFDEWTVKKSRDYFSPPWMESLKS